MLAQQLKLFRICSPLLPNLLVFGNLDVEKYREAAVRIIKPALPSDESSRPSAMDTALSQLTLQRDFCLGLLGNTHTHSSFLDFLALDATFLGYLKSVLASPAMYPHQATSCLPHIIRSIMKSKATFVGMYSSIEACFNRFTTRSQHLVQSFARVPFEIVCDLLEKICSNNRSCI